MNLQKYSAPSMREAINRIRSELGVDAVIVNSVQTVTGVDVVAATDYDEKLAGLLGDSVKANGAASARTYSAADDPALAAAKRVMGNAVPADEKQAAPRPFPMPITGTVDEVDKTLGTKHAASIDVQLDDSYEFAPVDLPLHTDASAAGRQASVANIAASDRNVPEQARSATYQSNRMDDVSVELRSLRDLVEQQLTGLAWQQVQHRDPYRADTLKRLLRFGLSPELCVALVNELPQCSSPNASWEAARDHLAKRIPIRTAPDLLETGGMAALVGPTGAGKTTTVAKLAALHILRHGPGTVGLITTDDYRLGAHEQLQAFGRILDISVARARDKAALVSAVRSFQGRSLILVDTEGGTDSTANQRELLTGLTENGYSPDIYVVLAANMQRTSLNKTIALHGPETLTGAITTKLDEAGGLGEVLSTLMKFSLPLSYVTDGQQVPHDLHKADASELVERGERLASALEEMSEEETLGLTFGSMVATRSA
jgi:flagellar biosynthesis protein FlhF